MKDEEILRKRYCKEFKRSYNKKTPNKACAGQVGTARLFEHFSGFKFFLLPNIVHVRPAASNAHR
jgi:hypothetical protein